MEGQEHEYAILLHIAEGLKLSLKGEKILVIASLGGNKLETESVNSLIFRSNLIWETDKQSIKRMKTENLPIRLECYSLNERNGQFIRTMIGYVLLPIRGVQIILANKPISVAPHWHKLVGLNGEWKTLKPEILLYLTITNKINLEGGIGFWNKESPTIENSELIPLALSRTENMLTSQQGLNIQLLQEEGLLQVGDFNNECDIFVVKVFFKQVKNLVLVNNTNEPGDKLYRFYYNLLGSPAYCPLIPNENSIFLIQEKIAINFRSTLKSIKEYFKKVFHIPVAVYCNDFVIGSSELFLDKIIQEDNLEEFLEKYKTVENECEYEGTFLIEQISDLKSTTIQPYIDYIFSIKYLSTMKIGTDSFDCKAGGDRLDYKRNTELPPTMNIDLSTTRRENSFRVKSDSILLSECNTNENPIERLPKKTKSEPSISCLTDKTHLDNLLEQKIDMKSKNSIPHTFSFNLNLQMIKFTRRPELGIWQISLRHPKSDTPFTLANIEFDDISSNLIEFKDLELQLFFASNNDDILDVIESDTCTLNINGPRGMYATAEIDNEILLVGTKEKSSGVILMENESGEKIAMAHIFVYLNDLGINFNCQLKKYPNIMNQTKPIMDERLAYKIVEELEDWKIKQQEIFLVELKRKEINHLALLSSEWKKNKIEKETQLSQKLEECTRLTEGLEDAYRALKDKGINQIEEEQIVDKTKAEMEREYSIKMLHLVESNRRLQSDLERLLQIEVLKREEVENSKQIVEKENNNLKLEIKALEKQIKDMKQNYLSREQLATLFQDLRTLSERLEEVQQSKIFYKDQWAKIIREVHKMKSDNLQQIEWQIKRNQSAGLENFFANEHDHLLSEREELEIIKFALDDTSSS